MRRLDKFYFFNILALMFCLGSTGCTVKAVGDPNRPITINANITIDIKGLEKTASSIEDYISSDQGSKDNLTPKGEKK